MKQVKAKMEAEVVVTFTCTFDINDTKEARQKIAELKRNGSGISPAILKKFATNVKVSSINLDYLDEDLASAIEGVKENGIGGTLSDYIDVEGD